ncbi:hypothetical protein FISHEDRAFT_78677 [Fistulina hepatica ATCC 64428]|uniref:ATP-dependent DNA helicase n=1 Tax=Fistulina hepatica ATCC 64428 TaxID=1128425 RepID=A0A0D7A097_9AGAR|nr:hypothetical protein FISHEDRAFT_78677 [Fistulina hepatica ATCC 64428]
MKKTAQVGIVSYFTNYATETRPNTSSALGSKFLSVAQGCFAVGCFTGSGLMRFFKPRLVFGIYFAFVLMFIAASIRTRCDDGTQQQSVNGVHQLSVSNNISKNLPPVHPRTLDSFSVPLSSTSSGASKNQPIKLNGQQEMVHRMVLDGGKNVFLTGSAGTGTLLLLRTIIDTLHKKYGENLESVAVTAGTGMAASNISGAWQLILLPPVTRGSTEPIFAFESPAWQACIEQTINQTQLILAEGQPYVRDFVDCLNEFRSGTISQHAINAFKGLTPPLPPSDLQPTELLLLRAEADKASSTCLDAINEGPVTFTAINLGSAHQRAKPDRRTRLLEILPVPEQLHLTVGVQEIPMKNIDKQLVDGTVGTEMSSKIYPPAIDFYLHL